MTFDAGRFGLTTRAALRRDGVDDRGIARRVADGSLEVVGRGVYRIGSPDRDRLDSWRERCAVAVACGGPDAVLARGTAAALWGLDGFDPPQPIDVNLPRRSGRRGAGRRRVHPLDPNDERGGLPVTSVRQTLLELGHGLDGHRVCSARGELGAWLDVEDRVELAVEAALRRRLVGENELVLLARTSAGQRGGSAVLDAVLARRPYGAPPTESYLETRGVQVLRRAGLPTGRRQAVIRDDHGRFVARVDLLLAERVAIEFDGRETHDVDVDSFSADRRRWTRLTELGLLVGVFTHHQVEFEPGWFIGRVRGLLARR